MTQSIHCPLFADLAPEWSFGPPSPALAAHLASCPSCRSAFEDFAAIRSAAAPLAEAEPPEQLWLSLRDRLRAEGIIRTAPRRSRFFAFLDGMPRPALTMAYASILIFSTFLLGSQTTSIRQAVWTAGLPSADSSLDSQMRSVEQGSVTAAMRSPSPAVRASLSSNLAMIDHYISLCRQSVQDSPQSEIARDYLYGAYQQKAELLADMADHGMDSQ